ncbi:hypothetical protein V1511DRAFT_375659 [Dipodascopsis uninucleata]
MRKRTESTENHKKKPKRNHHAARTLDDFFVRSARINTAESSSTPAAEKTDEEIARDLQAQFDAEYNEHIQSSQENKESRNGDVLELKDHTDLPYDISSSQHYVETSDKQQTRKVSTHFEELEQNLVYSSDGSDNLYDYISTVDFTCGPEIFDIKSISNQLRSYISASTPYALLSALFSQVDATKSRIRILNSITNFLRVLIAIDPQSIVPAVWLSTNSIAPPYEYGELGIGGSLLSRTLRKISGISAQRMKALYDKHGDIGDVAFESKVSVRTLVKPTRLTISDVYNTLWKIANAKGPKSQDIKMGLIERLLIRSKNNEIRYLARTLVAHLRIGAVRTTMIVALARAFCYASQNDGQPSQEELTKAEESVRQCYARHPNYNHIIPALIAAGTDHLSEICSLTVHVPLMPMLGSITRDISEMLVRVGSEDVEFACEFKYDGQRAQVHYSHENGSHRVSLFSRHLETMTDKYPDVVHSVLEMLPKNGSIQSFILEGEIVAIDGETGALKSFQSLSNRARKDVSLHSLSVNVCLFVFDLMYLNGTSLLDRPLRKRRELLRTTFATVSNKFEFVASIDARASDTDAISAQFRAAIDNKCEGIMVKILDTFTSNLLLPSTTSSRRSILPSTYAPDKRLESWLKVKKDYDSAADSLDLVPIGGWYGQGRKAAWWSPVLLALRDPDTGIFHAVCKCMSGFSDAVYKEIKAEYHENSDKVTRTMPSDIDTPLIPEYFWHPREVWEIKFADITLSPTYSAGKGLSSALGNRGLSIRFPRFIRKRSDKSIEEASTPRFLVDLYLRQEQRGDSLMKDDISVRAADDMYELF